MVDEKKAHTKKEKKKFEADRSIKEIEIFVSVTRFRNSHSQPYLKFGFREDVGGDKESLFFQSPFEIPFRRAFREYAFLSTGAVSTPYFRFHPRLDV